VKNRYRRRATGKPVFRVSLRQRLLAADDGLFVAVARWHSPVLDRLLPALSQAANLSRLWFACAALLRLAAGEPGARAAKRGLLSLVFTWAVVNLLLKPAFGRTRPPLGNVPVVRRLRRQPRSTSFPSGHAANAGAFATGASRELPAAAPVLMGLAGTVAFSRIYTGVHHPSDVVAGFTVGGVVAVLTRARLEARANRERSRRSAAASPHPPTPASS
jgi:undecaprenyl-diphosphatase